MSIADDFFAGGLPSAKFPTVGTTVIGTITRVGERMQQRDFTTGEPKHYPPKPGQAVGDPMWQVPIDIQTELRDPEIANDKGMRTLYVKGTSMTKAFKKALRQASVPGPRIGGRVKVTYTGDGVAERGVAPKQFDVAYQPPADTAFAGDDDDYSTPVAQAAQVFAQAHAAAQQPETAGVGQRPW